MDNIDILPTTRTPSLKLNFDTCEFLLEGESYPEDTTKFYSHPIDQVLTFLGAKQDKPVTFKFKLKYFNSSSAKVIMDLFTALEESAASGNSVKIEWHFVADDDNMEELGEEFSEELSLANFELIPF